MKLSKEHIVALSVLLLILLLLGFGYFFYYLPRMAVYAKNEQTRDDLKTALKNLETAFFNTEPEALISATKGSVQPLADEVERRAAFFSLGDMAAVEPVPEGKILRFYYEEQYTEMMRQLDLDIYARAPGFVYPKTFGVPAPGEMTGKTVTEEEVSKYLSDIKFGSSLIKMLLEAKAVEIREIVISPFYEPPAFTDLLEMRTTGCSITISLEDLVKFLDKLRLMDQYFTVNAISIRNNYLMYPVEPPVEVRMLLTQSVYKRPLKKQDEIAVEAAPKSAEQMLKNASFLQMGGQKATTQTQKPAWRKFLRKYFMLPL